MVDLKVGDLAPDFELPNQLNEPVRLSNYKNDYNVILSFHPLAWTGVCAIQMQNLNDASEKLESLDAVALGISVDSIPAKTAWFAALELEDLITLSDFEPKGEVARRYGVYREDGFSERAVFVIDKVGRIIFKKVYPISDQPDLDEVLEALK